jgi:hypothetical protein
MSGIAADSVAEGTSRFPRCQQIVRKAIAVLVALAGTAAADSTRVGFGAPTGGGLIEGVALELTTHTDHLHGALRLSVTTTSMDEIDVSVPIELPPGARVLGLVIEIPGERRIPATRAAAVDAVASYDGIVQRRDDLGLLLHAEPGQPDRYSLRIYPMQQERAAHVELLVEIPTAASLELASEHPIDSLAVIIDEAAPHPTRRLDKRIAIAIPEATHTPHVARIPHGLAAGQAYFAGDSIVALPGSAMFPAQTRVELDLMATEDIDDDNEIAPVELRKVVRTNLHSLAMCFPSGSTTRGRIDLRFAVLPNGRPTAVSIDGPGSRSVKRCMSARVGKWRFSSREDVAMGSFPLQVRTIR